MVLWFDRETSITSKEIKSFLESKGIHLYHTFSPMKSLYAERKIRDIRARLERYFTQNKTKKWISIIRDLEVSMNSTIVKSIGIRPIDVTDETTPQVFDKLYGDLIRQEKPEPVFKEGDFVRISRKRLIFEKSSKAAFSEEVFIVTKVVWTPPVYSYLVSDAQGEQVQGKFLANHLVKVNIPAQQ